MKTHTPIDRQVKRITKSLAAYFEGPSSLLDLLAHEADFGPSSHLRHPLDAIQVAPVHRDRKHDPDAAPGGRDLSPQPGPGGVKLDRNRGNSREGAREHEG